MRESEGGHQKYFDLVKDLSDNEINCIKYNHTIEGMPLVFDSFKAVIRLSKNAKHFKIHCFKPEVDMNNAQARDSKNGDPNNQGATSSSSGFSKILNLFNPDSKAESMKF